MAKYFPFLRAKQFDLKAVERAAAALVQNGDIMPILEPVRVATTNLVRRAARFAAAGLEVGLVMNPQVGELSGNPQATGGFALVIGPTLEWVVKVKGEVVSEHATDGEATERMLEIVEAKGGWRNVGWAEMPWIERKAS